jgi:hypothetical protein
VRRAGLVLSLLAACAPLLSPAPAAAAVVGSYALSLPAGEGMVMGDAVGTLHFTLANTTAAGGASIAFVHLSFDASIYNVSDSDTPPAGWKVTAIKNAGQGQTWIEYTATGAGIAPGASAVFPVILKGTSDGNVPAAAADVTDLIDPPDVETSGGNSFSGNRPTWKRYGLNLDLTASPATLGPGGTVTVTAAVANRTTGARTLRAGALTPNGSGGVTLLSGPSPASVSVAAGAMQYFTFTFRADSSGTVTFSGAASDTGSPATVTSPDALSNPVVIGAFTAILDLAPLATVTGQQVTVTMTVSNNSGARLAGVVPSLTPGGTAACTRVSGPTPASVANLQPGRATVFRWVYTVSGAIGATYSFSGSAAAAGGAAANAAASPVGRITGYGAVVDPDAANSAATGVSFTFTVFNQGANPARQIRIYCPTGWTVSGSTAPANWTASRTGTPTRVTFVTSTPASFIPTGGRASFTLTFSSFPAVPGPTAFTLVIGVWDTATATGAPATGAAQVVISLTPYTLALARSIPAGFPVPPLADGAQYYDLVATVTGAGGAPLAGAAVTFVNGAGTLTVAAPVTDAAGQARTSLVGPLSTTPVTAPVSASCRGAGASTSLYFQPYPGLALDYLPGTLAPVAVDPGQAGAVFSLRVLNGGALPVTLASSSRFRFADSTAGGTSSFSAAISSSAPAAIPSGGSALLTFSAGNVAAAFLSGTWLPNLWLSDGVAAGWRPVCDGVRVTAPAAGALTIIRWRETVR